MVVQGPSGDRFGLLGSLQWSPIGHNFASAPPQRPGTPVRGEMETKGRKRLMPEGENVTEGEPRTPTIPGVARRRGPGTEIDFERVIYDPEYRRWARDQLNRLRKPLRGKAGGKSPR